MDHLKTVPGELDTVHCSIELDVARSIRILLVEDDLTIAAVAMEMLEEQGWQVQACNDGNAASEHLTGAVHYDFLLVDYGLPGINGLACQTRAQTGPPRSHTNRGAFGYAGWFGGTRSRSRCFFAEIPGHDVAR